MDTTKQIPFIDLFSSKLTNQNFTDSTKQVGIAYKETSLT